MRIDIKFITKYLAVVAVAFLLAACGGGGSSSGAAAPTSASSSPNSGTTGSTAIDPATGSVAAAEVTCQGACVSLSADAGTSTE